MAASGAFILLSRPPPSHSSTMSIIRTSSTSIITATRTRRRETTKKKSWQHVQVRGMAEEEEKSRSRSRSSSGSRFLEIGAAVGGLVANPVVWWSLYTLKTTGCGLPPGPIGALEGLSYLLLTALVSWSLSTKLKTGSGPPSRPLFPPRRSRRHLLPHLLFHPPHLRPRLLRPGLSPCSVPHRSVLWLTSPSHFSLHPLSLSLISWKSLN